MNDSMPSNLQAVLDDINRPSNKYHTGHRTVILNRDALNPKFGSVPLEELTVEMVEQPFMNYDMQARFDVIVYVEGQQMLIFKNRKTNLIGIAPLGALLTLLPC